MQPIRLILGLQLVLAIGTAASAAAGEVIQVKIGDLAFSPSQVTAHVGDAVEWVNDDFVDHTATENHSQWDVAVAAGQSAQIRLEQFGLFEYFCRFHPGMTGKIRVIKD